MNDRQLRYALAVRDDALVSGDIDRAAQPAERPAQGGLGIVGQLPEQFAQPLAPVWTPSSSKESQQRTGLPRGREIDVHAIGRDAELAQ